MINSNEFEVKRNQFLTYLTDMDNAVVEYVNALKKKSSEELLNGSPSVAKNYLEEILLLETNTKNFTRMINNIRLFIDKDGGHKSEITSSTSTVKPEEIKTSVTNDATEDKIEKSEIEDQVKKPAVEAQMKKLELDIMIEEFETETHIKESDAEAQTIEPLIDEPFKKLELNYVKEESEIETKTKEPEVEVQNKRSELKEQIKKIIKPPKKLDSKIPILKSLIYLGGMANEEELKKYIKQFIDRNGDSSISIDELKANLDQMFEKEMISVDPLDENIEILQTGIDYLAKYEV